jgi:hypothetical protein
VIKTLAVVSIIIGLLAGWVISSVWEKPGEVETAIARAQWESERTNATLSNRPEPPEPDWDGRPGLARHPWIAGASTSVVIFVTGLLAITAVRSESPAGSHAMPDNDDYPDTDLIEELDDPFDPPTPHWPQIHVNPRTKDQ